MSYQVVVTCTKSPCAKCRSCRFIASEGHYFLRPLANGTFLDRARAEADARHVQGVTGKDSLHRYDVVELRADGWPLCPWCGNDELYSLATPADPKRLDGCYVCGRTLEEAAAKHDLTRPWMMASAPWVRR